MTLTPSIDPNRLNSVRRARKMGRPRLAKLIGMTERQIARLESTGAPAAEQTVGMLERIAVALQVMPGVLTGQTGLIETDLMPLTNDSVCRTGCCG